MPTPPQDQWWAEGWEQAVHEYGPKLVRLTDGLTGAAQRLGEAPTHPRESISAGMGTGFRPVRALLEAGYTPDDLLTAAIGPAVSAPRESAHPVRLRVDPTKLAHELIEKVGLELCQRHFALPMRYEPDGSLVVALRENKPLTALASKELQEAAGATAIIPAYAPATGIAAAFTLLETSQDLPTAGEESAEASSDLLAEAVSIYTQLTEADSRDPQSVADGNFLKALLETAIAWESADIHLHTEVDTKTGKPKFLSRMDRQGHIVPFKTDTFDLGQRVMARIRAISQMPHDRVRPQDANLGLMQPGTGLRFDLRISAVPLVDECEMMTLRLLPLERPHMDSLTTLFPPDEMPVASGLLREAINQPDGLIVITGRTGDGKSTTLAAMLAEIADPSRKIVTAEDPVEYRIAHANQVQVSKAQSFDFVQALRAFLRSAPDVIMIGEIRDEETAEAALRAAETGHLVCSTLHVKDAASALTRLRGLGIETEQIASSLSLIVSQRLVRTVCSNCKGSGLDKGKNCGICQGNGWGGRTAVIEMLKVGERLLELLSRDIPPTPAQIRELQEVKFSDHCKVLLDEQRTTKEEIVRVFGTSIDLSD